MQLILLFGAFQLRERDGVPSNFFLQVENMQWLFLHSALPVENIWWSALKLALQISSRENVLNCPLGCPSSWENIVKCLLKVPSNREYAINSPFWCLPIEKAWWSALLVALQVETMQWLLLYSALPVEKMWWGVLKLALQISSQENGMECPLTCPLDFK